VSARRFINPSARIIERAAQEDGRGARADDAPALPQLVVDDDLLGLALDALLQVRVAHLWRAQELVIVGRVSREADLAQDEHARVLERLVEVLALGRVAELDLGLRAGRTQSARVQGTVALGRDAPS